MTPTDKDREAAEELLRAKWLGLSDSEYVKLFTEHFARRAEAARRDERESAIAFLRKWASEHNSLGWAADAMANLWKDDQLGKDGA